MLATRSTLVQASDSAPAEVISALQGTPPVLAPADPADHVGTAEGAEGNTAGGEELPDTADSGVKG